MGLDLQNDYDKAKSKISAYKTTVETKKTKVLEKKLTLSKLQSTIWEKSNNNKEESFSLSDMDEDTLQSLIKKDVENNTGENYKL